MIIALLCVLVLFIEKIVSMYPKPSEEITYTVAKSSDIASSAESKPAQSKLININTAGVNELMTLEGIGEAKAKAIIAYRDEKGAFKQAIDITLVDGIGQKTYEKIKNYICAE